MSTSALAGGLVLYLSLEGGGYDILVHSQVGIVVWWIVLVGSASGLLPTARITRIAWAAVVAFGAFVAWTAIAGTWSLSSERSLQDLSLVAGYLGVLVLAIALNRERAKAVKHTINAVAATIVIVAGLALASRLRPGLFAGALQTSAFLPGTEGRLAWPLNYWNALAALMALGLPLLLAIATSARTLWGQAAAAAGTPLVALCGCLTFSRGGAGACAVGVIAFLILAPDRIPKLVSALLAAAGSAALIAGAEHRGAVEHGLANAAARQEGATLMLAIVFVCVGVGLAQAGIGLAVRHGRCPRWLTISPKRARSLSAGSLAACVIVALASHAPTRISHAWQDFKHPTAAALHQDALGRFGTVSGSGRYDYWSAAVNATGGRVLDGSGPGTFQLLWLPRAPYYSYVENAHSLYVETLAEVGVVGLVLLVGFLAIAVTAAIALVARSSYEGRTRAAGLTAALVAFLVSAAFDWTWQVPALPAAFLVLVAATLGPRQPPARGAAPVARAGAIVVALGCLLAIAVPFATTAAVRQSQVAFRSGDPSRALEDARTAAHLAPSAASPQLQLALVLELQGDYRDAVQAARRATSDEPATWSAWLVRSRLEAEAGLPAASLGAYRRARSLNPRSPLFAQ